MKGTNMRSWLAFCLVLTLVGCTSNPFSGLISNRDLAYLAAKEGTALYLQNQSSFPASVQDAIVQVWEGFDENEDAVLTTPVADIPDLIKAKTGNNSVVNSMVDILWQKVNAKIDLASLDTTQLKEVIAGVHDGIEAGIAEYNNGGGFNLSSVLGSITKTKELRRSKGLCP